VKKDDQTKLAWVASKDVGGRKGIQPVKTEWWDAGMVICLE